MNFSVAKTAENLLKKYMTLYLIVSQEQPKRKRVSGEGVARHSSLADWN